MLISTTSIYTTGSKEQIDVLFKQLESDGDSNPSIPGEDKN